MTTLRVVLGLSIKRKGGTMDKDMKRVVKAAKEQGYTVTLSTKGHPLFSLDGRVVATGSGTSSDRRALANLIARLRRSGFQWPPKR
jgi:hypothetical protein